MRRLTLARIAQQVGISQKTLGYYYRYRDDIVQACFLDAIRIHSDMLGRALRCPRLEDRVASMVAEYFRVLKDVRLGQHRGFVYFGDLRAIGDDGLAKVGPAYVAMFRLARDIFTEGQPPVRRAVAGLWAHALLSQLYWAVVWTRNLVPEDFAAAATHLTDILLHGIGAVDAGSIELPTAPPPAPPDGEALSHAAFLMAATRMINAKGYRALSVDGTSEALGVTKGSFYHHNSNLGELVQSCFDRTYNVIRQAQNDARLAERPGLLQIIHCVCDLIDRQLSSEMELLRTSALTSVDPDLRARISSKFDTLTLRFASMLNSGLMDGSVRTCNILVAAEFLTALINSAQETRYWAPKLPRDAAIGHYVGLLQTGYPQSP